MNKLYVDIETVRKPELEELYKESYPKAAIEKMALSPVFAQIACICALRDGGKFEHGAWEDGGEKEMLRHFWAWVDTLGHPTLVTYNGKTFDYPFIVFRSWHHKVPPTMTWDTKRYSWDNHRDLRLILFHGDISAKGRFHHIISLQFGHQLEADKDKIWELWNNKEYSKIMNDSCWPDVEWLKKLDESLEGYY